MTQNLSVRLQQWSESEEGESQTSLVPKKKSGGGYVCPICFVSFGALKAVKYHMARFQDRKYPCNECGTKFSNMHLLQSHITFAHDEESLKNYRMTCPVCNHNSHIETNFRSHICHLHSEWVEENLDPFVPDSWASVQETQLWDQNRDTPNWKRNMIIKFVKHIIRGKSTNDNEIVARKTGPSKNNFCKESFSEASRVYRDAESLRVRYSCKDCYVPLTRIDIKKNMVIKLVTPLKQCKKNLEKKSSYRADESKTREEMNRKTDDQMRLCTSNIEVRLDKLSVSKVFINSDCDDNKDCEISIPVTEALEKCIDPLDLGETLTETTSSFAQYPIPFEFPVKIETMEGGTQNPEQCTKVSFEQVKVESMDCGDSPERIETVGRYTGSQEIPGCPETVQYYYGEQSGEFSDASITCTDTFEPVKLEIEEHPIPQYPECESVDAVECLVVPDKNSAITETNSSPTPGIQETEVEGSCTVVASRICNKLFTKRRAMLLHFRKRHLSCFDDTVYCVCGKEMNGRREMEKHFSRHCDRLVKTTRITTEVKSCKPLEKKYKCTKCEQRFWLPTCLADHPPNCELPKSESVNPGRFKKNINIAFELPSHSGDVREFFCRICDVKFTSINRLFRHLNSYSSTERCPCIQCGTVFAGPRLLKGHVQSTHEPNSRIVYTFFCEICNQGFTKKINHRIHTMHVHPKDQTMQIMEAPTECPSTENVGPSPPENQCNVCNLVFVSHKRFIDHVSYYNRSTYRCNICWEQFDGQYKVHHHRKKVHYGGKLKTTYTHYCDLCKEGFMYKTHLHAHMFHVHDDEFNCVTSIKDYNLPEENGHLIENSFPCKQCSKNFPSISVLLTHIDLNHGENVPKVNDLKCSQCDTQFPAMSDFITHFKDFHSALPSSHVNNSQGLQSIQNNSAAVDVIDISTSDENGDSSSDPNAEETQPRETGEANIQDSTNQEEDNATRPSVCLTCGFSSSVSWALASHKAFFANEGIYVCEFCGRRFSWQTYYRDHKLKHFRRDEENNYSCPICDEGFDTIDDTKMHALHLHKELCDSLKCDAVPHTFRPNVFRNELTDSNYIGGLQQPLTVGRNNDSQEKHRQDEQLQGNAKSTLQQASVVRLDTPAHSSSSLNSSPLCNICNITFISKETLKIHRETNHSWPKENSSAIVMPDFPPLLLRAIESRTPQADANDRFYVVLTGKIPATAIDYLGKRIKTCSENIGLGTKLYRYDASPTCDVCNLTFQTIDALNSHRAISHKIKTNFFSKRTSDDGKQFSQIKETENKKRELQGHDETRVVQVSSTASIPVLQLGCTQLQADDQSSTKIDQNVGGENIPTKMTPVRPVRKVYYKCGLCSIIFNDENLMAVHEEKVHGLTTVNVDSLFDQATIQPLSSSTDAFQSVGVNNLSLDSRKECHPSMIPVTPCIQADPVVYPVTGTVSPEEILISDEEAEVSVEPIPIVTNSSSSRDKESGSPPPLRLRNLPPGNYKISKLKVRSTDMGKVTKLV